MRAKGHNRADPKEKQTVSYGLQPLSLSKTPPIRAHPFLLLFLYLVPPSKLISYRALLHPILPVSASYGFICPCSPRSNSAEPLPA